jgi:hypothetical protein
LAEERTRKCDDLLRATEAHRPNCRPYRPRRRPHRPGQDRCAVGRIENRYKLAKHFDIAVAEDGFTLWPQHARIAEEAELDGFYVIRTSREDKVFGPGKRGRRL